MFRNEYLDSKLKEFKRTVCDPEVTLYNYSKRDHACKFALEKSTETYREFKSRDDIDRRIDNFESNANSDDDKTWHYETLVIMLFHVLQGISKLGLYAPDLTNEEIDQYFHRIKAAHEKLNWKYQIEQMKD